MEPLSASHHTQNSTQDPPHGLRGPQPSSFHPPSPQSNSPGTSCPLACLPQGLCLGDAFYQECPPQVLAWCASSLIHISAIKTISPIDLPTTAASDQPSLPHLEWFLHSSEPLDVILFVFIGMHQWDESSPRAVTCQAEVIPPAPDQRPTLCKCALRLVKRIGGMNQ